MELIIVIAIMAILVAVLAPQFLKYVKRARIAADISNADELAKSFTVMMTDEDYIDFQGYVNYNASEAKRLGNSHYYRVITFANDTRAEDYYHSAHNGFQITNVAAGYCGSDNTKYENLKSAIRHATEEVLGTSSVKVNLYKQGVAEEWIVCVDKDGKFYVFVGSNENKEKFALGDNKKENYGSGRQCYMLYPEVDDAYNNL